MRKSKVLKGISYCLIPVFLLIVIVSLFYEMCKDTIEEPVTYSADYFETDDFLDIYMGVISYSASNLIYNNDNFSKIQDGDKRIYYTYEHFAENYSGRGYIKDFYFLIQYQNLILTNVELTEETNTFNEIKHYIDSRDGKKANIINGNVTADSKLISNKALQYFNNFNFKYYTIIQNDNSNDIVVENAQNSEENEVLGVYDDNGVLTYQNNTTSSESETATEIEVIEPETKVKEYHETNINDFQIYSTYKEEMIVAKYQGQEMLEEIIRILVPYENIIIYALPISSVVTIVLLLYIVIAVGHSKDKNGIDLNDIDKAPIEIVYLIYLTLFGIFVCLPVAYLENFYDVSLNSFLSISIAAYFITYITLMASFVTTIKRLKAKCFWKTSLTGRFCVWCIKIIKKCWRWCINSIKSFCNKVKTKYRETTKSWNKTAKLLIILVGYVFLTLLLIAMLSGLGFIIAIGIGIYLIFKFNEKISCYEKIEQHLKEMYNGDHSKKLNYQEFTPEFQDIVKYINDVSSGFENAIQEGIKSERLKTELITNVSHDIKTPLTSIINYVDLLKEEDIQSEKAKEYIEVLDKKSQRLKKLTEDLVEASKASSGNVKLNIEKINISELVKQTTGEFEDKFKEKNLDIITNFPEEMIYINADNRYMYRIIENLFSNISKYALENSRVYIDVKAKGNKVKIYIKNISKEKLNISAEELMQRFVRGDKSRTTEGSGLGISISKSLTEIQNGKFELQVDGDLFKIELEFDITY